MLMVREYEAGAGGGGGKAGAGAGWKSRSTRRKSPTRIWRLYRGV